MAGAVSSIIPGFTPIFEGLLGQQLQQEVNQTVDNIRMDQLKHLGKLVSDAASISQ
jgi:hypothetical protein